MIHDYDQPLFYRFNSDSIDLIKWIELRYKKLSINCLLDIGAGCGVLGLELAKIFHPIDVTFIEVQEDFIPFIHSNCEKYLSQSDQTFSPEIFHGPFSVFDSEKRYDLIVCNPPYYIPGKGKLSQDHRRSVARTFIIDDWPSLLALIEKSLALEGVACLVLKKEDLLLKRIITESINLDLRMNPYFLEKVMIIEIKKSVT